MSPALQPGTIFEHYEGEPGRWKVVLVSASSALARPLGVVQQEIYTKDGKWVTFNSHGRAVRISRNAMVRIVEEPKKPKQSDLVKPAKAKIAKGKEKHK